MNTWENTILTDQGRVLMSKLTQGHTLNITRAVAGAGFVTPGLLPKQTSVTDPKQTLIFRAASYPEAGVCKLPVVLDNDELTEGYKVTQVGVFATDPDAGEILLFISQSADAASGTIVPSATEMPAYSAEWMFYLSYGQADGVNITVDPTRSVSWSDMEAYVEANAFSEEKIEAFVEETFTPITEEEVNEIFSEYGGEGGGGTSATVTNIDFSNLENGTFTETLSDGSKVSHPVIYDDSGRAANIDGFTITW